MTEPIITPMRQYATHLIEQCSQGKLPELNGEPDHIHILFELPATAAPSVVVCRIHPRPTMSDEVFCGELDKTDFCSFALSQRGAHRQASPQKPFRNHHFSP